MIHELAFGYKIDKRVIESEYYEMDYWQFLVFENLKALREREELKKKK